jgi:transcriptional regulator with XRE-family HTH domain
VGANRFDLGGLFSAVAGERERRGLSWAELSRQVGVAASTIRRMAEADDAEADGVLALIGWLGVAPESFVGGDQVSEHVSGEVLPTGEGGYIRVDMDLVAEADGDSRGSRGRTRTTIQRLVAVAKRSGQSVASLTRVSEV